MVPKMATRWTDPQIKKHGLTAGKTDERIAIEPGLYLRLRATKRGVTRTFEYRAQVAGKRKFLTLGPYSPHFGLHEARRKLIELQHLAAQARIGEGDHPVTAERSKREGRRSDPTFDVLFRD